MPLAWHDLVHTQCGIYDTKNISFLYFLFLGKNSINWRYRCCSHAFSRWIGEQGEGIWKYIKVFIPMKVQYLYYVIFLEKKLSGKFIFYIGPRKILFFILPMIGINISLVLFPLLNLSEHQDLFFSYSKQSCSYSIVLSAGRSEHFN